MGLKYPTPLNPRDCLTSEVAGIGFNLDFETEVLGYPDVLEAFGASGHFGRGGDEVLECSDSRSAFLLHLTSHPSNSSSPYIGGKNYSSLFAPYSSHGHFGHYSWSIYLRNICLKCRNCVFEVPSFASSMIQSLHSVVFQGRISGNFQPPILGVAP